MADTTTTNEVSTEPNRRTVLKGLAVAGAAVPVLVACGSDSSNSSSDTTPTTDSTPTKSDPTTPDGTGDTSSDGGSGGKVLVKASDVPVGGGVILAAQKLVVTQPKAGEFEGFSAVCTHMGCTVNDISNGLIICPCHGSQYSITDGSVQGGPAPAPLPKKPVSDDGGNIVAG